MSKEKMILLLQRLRKLMMLIFLIYLLGSLFVVGKGRGCTTKQKSNNRKELVINISYDDTLTDEELTSLNNYKRLTYGGDVVIK